VNPCGRAADRNPRVNVGQFEAQPLSGIRVLELSDRTGAYCGKILADLGAEVVKVELPTGDRLRSVPPYRDGAAGPEASLVFAYYHHNKRGITLNWERDESQPLLRELVSTADVVLASPKGNRHRLTGYVDDPPSLPWVSGNVLTCFISPFGLTGPYREWRATPFTSFAASGYMQPFGPPDGPPLAMPGQQLYDEAGIGAAFLIQMVLRSPPHTRSQIIDHSVHEMGLFNKLGQEQYSLKGTIKTRATNFGPPPGGIWRCKDGMLDIGANSPQQWDIFVELLDSPDVLADPIFRDRKMRVQAYDVITELIADLLSTRSARQLVEAGQAAGLPCALTNTPSQFVQEEQARARGFFVRTSREGSGEFDIPGPPFMSSPPLLSFRKSAPLLGEANEELYMQELGHLERELRRWRSDGLL
jgi:crotonobetainyl-CoA:carnitine CoA-transferase CaiB-like acyl-CoA transferase